MTDSIKERIMQAVGEASMCWSNIEGAGVFESEKAEQIGKHLLEFLQEQEEAEKSIMKEPAKR